MKIEKTFACRTLGPRDTDMLLAIFFGKLNILELQQIENVGNDGARLILTIRPILFEHLEYLDQSLPTKHEMVILGNVEYGINLCQKQDMEFRY